MIDPSKLFPPMARAVDRHRAGIASDKIIVADMLDALADIIRGKPEPKTNGATPPPTSMQKWAAIQMDSGEAIEVFTSMGAAMTYITGSGCPKNLKLKKLDP